MENLRLVIGEETSITKINSPMAHSRLLDLEYRTIRSISLNFRKLVNMLFPTALILCPAIFNPEGANFKLGRRI